MSTILAIIVTIILLKVDFSKLAGHFRRKKVCNEEKVLEKIN
jgi:hypothetical protein